MPTKRIGGARMRTKKAPSRRGPRERPPDVDGVLGSLRRLGKKRIRDEMGKRYGITGPTAAGAFGVPMAAIQRLAKQAGTSHELALALWQSGQYEARLMAAYVDEPARVTAAQMDRWCRDFDNWGVCDTVCFKLFDKVPAALAFAKVDQWSGSGRKGGPGRDEEFVVRGAFVLLACLALHDKETHDEEFLRRLPLIAQGAIDERNFVKKGVSWALRSIGRRSAPLNEAAVAVAERLCESPTRAARWVGQDARRELTSAAVRRRLER